LVGSDTTWKLEMRSKEVVELMNCMDWFRKERRGCETIEETDIYRE
jgi:hypothetical protein